VELDQEQQVKLLVFTNHALSEAIGIFLTL
jgi:hypothetical protein